MAFRFPEHVPKPSSYEEAAFAGFADYDQSCLGQRFPDDWRAFDHTRSRGDPADAPLRLGFLSAKSYRFGQDAAARMALDLELGDDGSWQLNRRCLAEFADFAKRACSALTADLCECATVGLLAGLRRAFPEAGDPEAFPSLDRLLTSALLNPALHPRAASADLDALAGQIRDIDRSAKRRAAASALCALAESFLLLQASSPGSASGKAARARL